MASQEFVISYPLEKKGYRRDRGRMRGKESMVERLGKGNLTERKDSVQLSPFY
jgi:hypothetical protein